jgi:flavorubredoxin
MNTISTDTAIRHAPVEVAPETWVIQATLGEGVNPQAVHMNSMVIRGREPVVVDTGCSVHRQQYLDDLFSLVEPVDVRWVVISHEDADHQGNLEAVMAACPNATLVATWFLCERLSAGGLAVPPTRWRWVGDGEALDVGDRRLVALRPALYDSPTTRGLFDPATGVYWASDCFAAPVARSTAFVDDMDIEAWIAGFTAFQRWNSPWVALVDEDSFAVECRRLEQLRPTTIATCHGPTIEANRVQQALDLLRSMPTAFAPHQPDQSVLDGIVAAMRDATIASPLRVS